MQIKTIIEAIRNNRTPITSSSTVEQFKKRLDHLSIVDGTLLLGDRVVIPQSMQSDILSFLHKSHPGMRRMKQLSRECLLAKSSRRRYRTPCKTMQLLCLDTKTTS